MFAYYLTIFSENRLWECRVFTVFADRQVRLDCIFTGFGETCLWECPVFSFKIARALQTSRVFLFAFARSCRQFYVLHFI